MLARECPIALVREVVEKGAAPEALWAHMVELGWPALTVPEQAGGLGMGAGGLAGGVEGLGGGPGPRPSWPPPPPSRPAPPPAAPPRTGGPAPPAGPPP